MNKPTLSQTHLQFTQASVEAEFLLWSSVQQHKG